MDGIKHVSLRALEARLERAVRQRDRLWAMIRLAEKLAEQEGAQTERALALFSEAELLASMAHDPRGSSAAIHGIGRCQLNLSNFPAALEAFGRALPIAEQTGYAENEILILRNIGTVYLKQNRHSLALETLTKCAELAELVGNTTMQASALSRIGQTLTNIGRYHEAAEYCVKSLALFEHAGTARDRASALLSLSNALHPIGKYAEAISALEQSSELRPDDGNKGICLCNIGVIYTEIGDYSTALSYLFTAAKFAATKRLDRAGGKLSLANAYANIMDVYLRLDNAEQGKDYGEKALAVFKEIGDQRGQTAMLGALGEHALLRGEKTRSRRLLKQCLDLSRETASKDYEAEALTILAKLEIDCGRFIAAEKLFREALRIATETDDLDRMAAALLGLGGLFNTLDQPDYALPLLERAITIAEGLHYRRREQEAHQMLAEALEARAAASSIREEDLKEAIRHWKLASSIKEEILGTEKQKEIAEIQIRADLEKLEQEKALLKKETDSKSREIEKMAMTLAEKTETIRSVARRIKEIIKPWSGNKRSEFDTLLSEIERGHRVTGEETIFNDEFHVVHRDFLQKLSRHHPSLTVIEFKVCVLLREEFSTKQMARMLKVTFHAVKKHRYEIRKKMKLEPWTSLAAVLGAV